MPSGLLLALAQGVRTTPNPGRSQDAQVLLATESARALGGEERAGRGSQRGPRQWGTEETSAPGGGQEQLLSLKAAGRPGGLGDEGGPAHLGGIRKH